MSVKARCARCGQPVTSQHMEDRSEYEPTGQLRFRQALTTNLPCGCARFGPDAARATVRA